ncbi:hypothetical protein MAPG_02600 [Magnaporthiopsis poae ATCC 64411]|uniref:Uncharacterized protein n=1 Tax=Magnaporthiopsis poae (strain ATCC 64411 / 73-15) TaxID=644358 RepID=A0A0C4DRT4_MAGP6|nr:hypothetical protein MAPG_02600 [Magnaporthiopsis poae ATCC 64411]
MQPSRSSSPSPRGYDLSLKHVAAATVTRFYFSYGVNMRGSAMRAKCAGSRAVGLALLRGHTWIVNALGLANVVRTDRLREVVGAAGNEASPHTSDGGEGVYGVVYELQPDDERWLDVFQDTAEKYRKWVLDVELIRGPPGSTTTTTTTTVPALVYLNSSRRCMVPRWPREARYADKMNRAIDCARDKFQLPDGYVEKAIRPTISASLESQRYSEIEDLDEVLDQPILTRAEINFWK